MAGRAGACALIIAAVLSLTQALDGSHASAGPPEPTFAGASVRAPLPAGADDRRRQVFTLGTFARLGTLAPPALVPAAIEVIPRGRAAVNVPILMYHYVRVNPVPWDRLGFGLSVTPTDFEAQVSWLAANGYHAIDLRDLEGYLAGARDLPSRPVVFTFDDGYEDFYTTAYPILRAHHYTAVSYVVTGFMGAPRYLSAAQVVELDAAGVEIAAHTVSHPDLTRLSAASLRHEVTDAKAMLEGLLGHPVLDFCYPSGRLDAAVVQEVQAAGFLSATTTATGTLHSVGDRFTWSRVRVEGGEPLATFVQNLGPSEPTMPVDVLVPRSRLSLVAP